VNPLRIFNLILFFPSLTSAACIPFDQALDHIGETQCVIGKVVRIESGAGGVHYLDFCEDYRLCRFTAVIFPHDLKNVGDVRQLVGKTVEIRGVVKEYDGRAEMILEKAAQLGGEARRISPLTKNFDVEEKGHFSAGKSRPSRRRTSGSKKQIPTLPIEIPEDVESN